MLSSRAQLTHHPLLDSTSDRPTLDQYEKYASCVTFDRKVNHDACVESDGNFSADDFCVKMSEALINILYNGLGNCYEWPTQLLAKFVESERDRKGS